MLIIIDDEQLFVKVDMLLIICHQKYILWDITIFRGVVIYKRSNFRNATNFISFLCDKL